MLMVKLGNYGADEPYEEKENCIGINVWKGKSADGGSHFTMNLSPSKIIGTVNLKRCGTIRPRSCAFEVKVLPALLALPQFQLAPDEPPFWNFSSPLFRFDVGWLYCMEAAAAAAAASGRGPPAHWPAALPGLAGASLACLFLDGAFGADALGPLPSLSRLPLLENVVIRNSPMRGFPPGYFDKSEEIKSLVIKHSVFRKIPSEITVLKKLRLFSLESIVQNFTFDPTIFSAFTNLWTLNLAGTHIEHWTGNIPKLQKLSILDLNRCQMKTFSAATRNLPALKIVSLKQNLISFLAPDAFAGVPNIRAIFLNENFINVLPPEIFVGLYRLRTLDLTSNRLTEWPQLPPNDFLKLNLSANNISKLINLGCQVRSIDFLDLSSTNLSQWDDPKVFLAEENCTKPFPPRSRWSKLAPSPSAAPRAWVARVNLSSNNMAVFSAAMLRSLDALAWVQLGGNAVDCGACESSALQGWLRSARAQAVAAGGPGGVRCRAPAAWAGRPVLSVDFDALCDTPRPALWLGLGLALAGAFALVGAAAGLLLYFRTEVAYLLHLAKVRSPSAKGEALRREARYDAFICYSAKNRKWVLRRLVPLLEQRPGSFSVCLFDRDFPLGSHIVANIADAIDQSRKVLLVLSQHFIQSKWCQWELELAQHKLLSEDRACLVLLELEPLERRRLPRLLRFLLDTRPVVRWPRPETAPAVAAAATRLRRALGPRPCQPPTHESALHL
ncbi:hypothetical protein R5R35_003675 [Gryllus longicercus]|uniref:TIR domain-containing protein n=1 Tax=Gryllus longicercus TaxID=2509291 RepID=A0AAN9VU60_9ORTH